MRKRMSFVRSFGWRGRGGTEGERGRREWRLGRLYGEMG